MNRKYNDMFLCGNTTFEALLSNVLLTLVALVSFW